MPEIKKGLVIDLGSVLINECAFAIVDEQVYNTLRVSLIENLPDAAEVVTPSELTGYTLAMSYLKSEE
ncbi:hypothetical protein KK083_21500 [Fulvivirgaceae bacterium PWU4]|uniref:Uncharacterized protein n=1 Tax=Chryseosolibacter histidini TaxID=2782349 RepID=A0AAP2GPV0_9BACT|nr:hypothetical protein [Chryseosolibacter histidini]MBT1699488.1 hypothetical protein [Chryseosolibacter histidini]